MNVTTLNQSSIPQTQVAINTAAKSNNELAANTAEQTTSGDSVELSAEGIAQSTQAAAAQGGPGDVVDAQAEGLAGLAQMLADRVASRRNVHLGHAVLDIGCYGHSKLPFRNSWYSGEVG